MAVRIEPNRVHPRPRRHGLETLRPFDVEDLEKARVADCDVEAPQNRIEPDHVRRTRERELGDDSVRSRRDDEQTAPSQAR